jgi:hypothetical protein
MEALVPLRSLSGIKSIELQIESVQQDGRTNKSLWRNTNEDMWMTKSSNSMQQNFSEDAGNNVTGHRISTVFLSEVCTVCTKTLHVFDVFLQLNNNQKVL